MNHERESGWGWRMHDVGSTDTKNFKSTIILDLDLEFNWAQQRFVEFQWSQQMISSTDDDFSLAAYILVDIWLSEEIIEF